jgi:hypothetical protein
MSWWGKVVDFWTGTERKIVRARNEKGQYVGDDESTPDINEAYEEVRVKRKPGRPKKEK